MEKRETALRKNQRSAEVYADTHAEYVLPDYLGEIRKILTVRAHVSPAAKYLSDGAPYVSGIVVYDILYTDSDGELTLASFNSDYDLALPRVSEDTESVAPDTRLVSFAVRPAGPRKLSAKATVAASHIASRIEDATPSGTAFEEGRTPESLTRDISLFEVYETEPFEREMAERILRLDGAIADETSVISAHAEAECESAVYTDGEASVKGVVTVYAIIKNEDSAPYAVTHKIPFAESIPCEGGTLFPKIAVSSLTTTISADDEGCEIIANLIIETSLTSVKNERATVVLDAYLCECECINTYGRLSYTELLHASREKISHTAKLPRTDESIADLDEPLMLLGTARVSASASGDTVSLSGSLKYSGAASSLSESGERSYMPIKLEVPIEECVKLERAVPEGAKIELSVSVVRPTLTLDADSVYLGSTLELGLVITEDKSVSYLESAEAGESADTSRATVTVYYPEADETLFSIAKSHRKSVAKLARDNNLAESAMAGGALSAVKKLIIY